MVTLGLVFSALSCFAWVRDGADAANWPWWSLAFLAAFLLGGISLVFIGLFGPTKSMEDWADVSSRHEVSIFIMALAYPVYLVLSPFYDRR